MENFGDAWESNPPRTALGCPATILKTAHHTSDVHQTPDEFFINQEEVIR
jgi:hypothetical protein